MQISLIVVFFLFVGWVIQDQEKVCFQSDLLKSLNLTQREGTFTIKDDADQSVEVVSLEDSNGILYWYRRVKTPVCLTGECKLIDIGIFWYFNGDFLGLEVYDEHLTKTDHSVFSSQDYQKLMSVLHDDWSILREYDRNGLLNENYEEIDGSTGATRKEIADESVTGAVYTTYTIWHLAYVGENEQLSLLTLDLLKNTARVDQFIASKNKKAYEFLLNQIATGYLPVTGDLSIFVLNALQSAEATIQNLALKALNELYLADGKLQNEFASLYNSVSNNVKRRLLVALRGVEITNNSLFNTLEDQLTMKNGIHAIEVLKLLTDQSKTSQKALNFSRLVIENEDEYERKVAYEYLELHDK